MSKWYLPKYSGSLILGMISIGLFSPLANAQDESTLNAAIQESIITNPKVLAAKQNRLSIDQAINQARAGFLPQIRLLAFYGPENSKNANTIAAVLQNNRPEVVNMPVRQVGLTVDQMLFDNFATSGEVKRNIARANSAAYQMLVAMQDVAISAIQAYFDIVREKDLVELAEKNVNSHSGFLTMITERTQHGLSNRADLVQIQGRLASAQANLEAERSNLNDAIARYRFVVGHNPPDVLAPPPSVPEGVLPENAEQAMEFASTFNPTVRFAREDMAAAYQQRQVAKARNLPQFSLSMGLDRNANVGGVRGPDNDQFAFLKMSYDIYTGGALVGREKETDHLLIQAREIMLNSYRQAQQDTRFTWDALKTAKRIIPYLEEYYNSTGNTIKAYGEQFQLSKRSFLDLLDVQNESYAAGRSYIEARYKVKLSEYQLLHNMGNLLQTLNFPLPVETYIYVFPNK